MTFQTCNNLILSNMMNKKMLRLFIQLILFIFKKYPNEFSIKKENEENKL